MNCKEIFEDSYSYDSNNWKKDKTSILVYTSRKDGFETAWSYLQEIIERLNVVNQGNKKELDLLKKELKL